MELKFDEQKEFIFKDVSNKLSTQQLKEPETKIVASDTKEINNEVFGK